MSETPGSSVDLTIAYFHVEINPLTICHPIPTSETGDWPTPRLNPTQPIRRALACPRPRGAPTASMTTRQNGFADAIVPTSSETITSAVAENYLTRREAAQVLRRSPGTLANWSSEGIGPTFIRIGGKTLYPERELRAWLDLHAVGVA